MPYLDDDYEMYAASAIDMLIMLKLMREKGLWNEKRQFSYGEENAYMADDLFTTCQYELFQQDRVDFYWPSDAGEPDGDGQYPWETDGSGKVILGTIKFFFFEELEEAALKSGRMNDYNSLKRAIANSITCPSSYELDGCYGDPDADEDDPEGFLKDKNLLIMTCHGSSVYNAALHYFMNAYQEMREFYKELMGEYPLRGETEHAEDGHNTRYRIFTTHRL